VSVVEKDARTRILGLSSDELSAALVPLLEEMGEHPYRARQIRDWLYARTPASFEGMSDLPRRVREALAARFVLHPVSRKAEQVSADGTRKYLWALEDGGHLESVSIPEPERTTYCISTQAGCPVKCTFCATGFGGFRGQIDAAEIVDQVLAMRSAGRPPTNIVYMGMGEPLLNWKPVARSLEILTSPEQIAFGARRITLSTVGIPEKIRELGREFPQVKLALSLHAPRNDLREEIIPLNRQFPLEEVLDAVRDHVRATGKKATFEYIVLPGVNDSEADATDLARLLDDVPSRINLIGFNPFPGADYEKPSVKRLLTFRRWLARSYPGDITIRRSRGEDIQGACGQLSLLHAGAPETPFHP